MFKDDQEIKEIYSNILNEGVIEESVKDLFNRLKNYTVRNMPSKEDFVYWLALFKSRGEFQYKRSMKKLRLYVQHGIGKEKYDHIVFYIMAIILNIFLIPVSVWFYKDVVQFDRVAKYVSEHKEAVIKCIDEIEQAVDKLQEELKK